MVCDSSSTLVWDFYLKMSIKAMTWQRDTVQLFLASSREPFFRNFFFFFFPLYFSLFPVMCVPPCCRRNITNASLCSLMRPGSCFMMNSYHFLFFLSLTFLATRLKYLYFSFCFPSMNYPAPREQLYFLHLAYAEREMVKTEWVFFLM